MRFISLTDNDTSHLTARLIIAKLKCERLSMSVMVAYVKGNDREYKAMDAFWRELERAIEEADLGENYA